MSVSLEGVEIRWHWRAQQQSSLPSRCSFSVCSERSVSTRAQSKRWRQWHLFFEPTIVGTVAGMVEAAVISFVLMYAFAWLYNAFAS